MGHDINSLYCYELARQVQEQVAIGTVQAKLVDDQQAVLITWSYGRWEMWVIVSKQELIHCKKIEVIAAHVANRIQAAINRNPQLTQDQ